MTRACDYCDKPAEAVVDETAYACAECVAVELGHLAERLGEDSDTLAIRWLAETPERNGKLYVPEKPSLYLPKRFVLEQQAEALEKINELRAEIEELLEDNTTLGQAKKMVGELQKQGIDYGIVGGSDGPAITLRRQGDVKDGEFGSMMVAQGPLGFGGASEHVTKALYRWLEKEKK